MCLADFLANRKTQVFLQSTALYKFFHAPNQIYNRRGDPEGGQPYGDEQDLDGSALEGGNVEEGRLIVLPVFLFDLALLVLDVEYGTSLWVVEGGRAVERPHQEGEEDDPSDGLQTQSPPNGSVQDVQDEFNC